MYKYVRAFLLYIYIVVDGGQQAFVSLSILRGSIGVAGFGRIDSQGISPRRQVQPPSAIVFSRQRRQAHLFIMPLYI